MKRKILTLVFLRHGNFILLGMKKRGFGEGKWNGFGGKLEEGESVESAAHREVKEESGLEAQRLEKVGYMEFFYPNEEKIHDVHIYESFEFRGEAKETEEMRPKWFRENEVPFSKMWPDDEYWFPMMFEGKRFQGKFWFDRENTITDYELHERKTDEIQ